MIRFTSRVVGRLVVVMGLAAVGCAGASASDASSAKPFDTSTCDWSGGLPDGSYAETCDSCAVEDATLNCVCKTETGAEQPSTLAIRQCATDVSNENGVLVENATPATDAPGADASTSADESSGACDLRAVNQSCTDYTGTAAELESQQATCVGKGGTWSQNKCPAPSNPGGCCSWEGHHACGYTQDAYFDQMDPCFANDVCNCDVG
ncbi:MAG TPA: hypothetical protein VMI54_04320 [Polyangiaceae bacterium]|nr:hypothetical protein [Polyangiaceae bacterium]